MSHNLGMNAGRESDGRVVPAKCPNKGGSLSPAEGMEGRRPTKENTGQRAASQMQSWGNALARLHRVREAAKREKQLRFTALLHHVSVTLLTNSFYALKRGAAPGVDGLTWQEYETDLDKRLEELHSRVHRGTYRALPSKRACIPKPDGRQRPLGIAALEGKIVQHAVGTVLNQIYEEDFLGFSYGFRPGRSVHNALDALSVGIMRKKVNWVLAARWLGLPIATALLSGVWHGGKRVYSARSTNAPIASCSSPTKTAHGKSEWTGSPCCRPWRPVPPSTRPGSLHSSNVTTSTGA
jgi:RNA-directed DNA polymerase